MEQNEMTTKKALLVLFFFIMLIGITIVIPAKWVGISSTKKGQALVLRSKEELEALSLDKNNNNTPDWRDLLLETTSTSTKNLAQEVKISEDDRKRLDDPNNITASISKNIYTAASLAKKGTLTEREQNDIVASIVKNEASKITAKEYFVDDLKIAKTESSTSKRVYGNTLGKLMLQSDKYNLTSSDLAILKAFNVNQDKSILASLVIKKNNLQTVIGQVLSVEVPLSAVPYHLLVLNRLSMYKTVLENLAEAENDPMRTTIAFNSYEQVVKSLFYAFTSMRTYFEIEGVVFSKEEPGYIFRTSAVTQ